MNEVEKLKQDCRNYLHEVEALKARIVWLECEAKAHDVASVPSLADAYVMGATGGPVVDGERLAFEEWMRGHCWALCATWNGTNYVSDCEQGGSVDGHAMRTRMLWAAWRDRAALVTTVQASVPDVSAMARALSDRYADQCGVDKDDNWKIYGQDFIDDVRAMLASAPQPVAQDGWIPVSERLPEGTVLASYTNNYNKSRIIRAKYVQKFTQESEDMDNFDAQYDEETDTYYDCEGWYELIDNWGDYLSVAVTEGTVTHWMPLPSAPKGGE